MARKLFVFGALFVGMCMLVAASAAGAYVAGQTCVLLAHDASNICIERQLVVLYVCMLAMRPPWESLACTAHFAARQQ